MATVTVSLQIRKLRYLEVKPLDLKSKASRVKM